MNTLIKFALGCLLGCVAGGASVGCTAILEAKLATAQCWCGERWSVQIAGATAFDTDGFPTEILASDTSYTRCVSMLDHLALDSADPQDPIYMALHDAFESEAIANCEIAGTALYPADEFDHTDCATTGIDPVATNLVYLGPCWEPDIKTKEWKLCPLDEQCGEFYDCSDHPIILLDGELWPEGETEGETEGNDGLWSCDEPRHSIGAPDTTRY